MDEHSITFGFLVHQWFNENISEHYRCYQNSHRFPHIYSVHCICVGSPHRALAVILDEELEARIFHVPVQLTKDPDWETIVAADPHFFEKFKTGLEKCHEARIADGRQQPPSST